MTVGRYGEVTPDEARTNARRILAGVAAGSDPAAERNARRKEMTVRQLFVVYELEGSQHLKERTRRITLARLSHHVLPLLGSKRLSDVGVADVERFVRDVKSGKTARDENLGYRKRIIVRGGEGAAGKVVRDLSAMFAFAMRLEIVASNPCLVARKPPDGRKHRFLTLEEVAKLGAALNELDAEGMNPKTTAIIRLLALTGCRREEIAALRWDEVSLEGSCLILQDSKTGRSYRPLGPDATDLLKTIVRTASPYVFPAERADGHFQGVKGAWPKIVERAKLNDVTPHTLRHTFGSTAASSGETLLMVGALLGHANQRSSSLYAHLQNATSLASAKRVSERISAALKIT
jgi:integrase